jgi:hypothetical protein
MENAKIVPSFHIQTRRVKFVSLTHVSPPRMKYLTQQVNVKLVKITLDHKMMANHALKILASQQSTLSCKMEPASSVRNLLTPIKK